MVAGRGIWQDGVVAATALNRFGGLGAWKLQNHFKNLFRALALAALLGGAMAAEAAAPDEDGGAKAGTEEGAAKPGGAREPPALPAEVEAILSEPAASDYPGEEQCIPRRRIREVKVVDERHVTFKVGREQLYLVQFKHRCPGLRRNDPVVYESPNGMSLCKHDTIRGLLPFGFGDNRVGPPCHIPGFQQITPEQLLALQEALKQRRRP